MFFRRKSLSEPNTSRQPASHSASKREGKKQWLLLIRVTGAPPREIFMRESTLRVHSALLLFSSFKTIILRFQRPVKNKQLQQLLPKKPQQPEYRAFRWTAW